MESDDEEILLAEPVRESKEERSRRRAAGSAELEATRLEIAASQRRRLKVLLGQSDVFAHFLKPSTAASSSKASGGAGAGASAGSTVSAASVGSPRRLAHHDTAQEAKEEAEEVARELGEKPGRKGKAAGAGAGAGAGAAAAADDDDDALDPPPRLLKQPKCVQGSMRDYQLEGLNWMISLHHTGLNGILADEMGLGKTLQTISLLGYCLEFLSIRGPHIVLVPKSTLANWEKEVARWCPSLRTLVLHGDKDSRADMIASHVKDGVDHASRSWDVLLTTYEVAAIEASALQKLSWQYLIIDEAHRIKNEHSTLATVARSFVARHRLLITGTPLQNNLHELWALLNFLLPDVFGSSDAFDELFNVTAEGKDEAAKKNMVRQLHAVLRPFMLRRLKVDVAKTLPPKTESLVFVGLTPKQRDVYRSILRRDLESVAVNKASGANQPRLANILMHLRKAVNHPYLFEGVEDRSLDPLGEHVIANCGKLQLLDKLLPRLKARGSRVLLFCQMTSMLDIIEDFMRIRGFSFARIDGSTPYEERESAIEEYNSAGSSTFAFLLSTRAGGLGINLYTADVVVLYDSDWNPQMDLQAQDRAHRIGQTKPVSVYRLVTEGTVEQKIVERAMMKLKLDAVVVQSGRLVEKSKGLSKEEMLNIVQFGATEIFKSSSDNPNAVVTDADVDAILSAGASKTKEMQEKIAAEVKAKLGLAAGDDEEGLLDFKFESTSMQTFEGEDYARGAGAGAKKKGADGNIALDLINAAQAWDSSEAGGGGGGERAASHRARAAAGGYNEDSTFRMLLAGALGGSGGPRASVKDETKWRNAVPAEQRPPRLEWWNLCETETILAITNAQGRAILEAREKKKAAAAAKASAAAAAKAAARRAGKRGTVAAAVGGAGAASSAVAADGAATSADAAAAGSAAASATAADSAAASAAPAGSGSAGSAEAADADAAASGAADGGEVIEIDADAADDKAAADDEQAADAAAAVTGADDGASGAAAGSSSAAGAGSSSSSSAGAAGTAGAGAAAGDADAEGPVFPLELIAQRARLLEAGFPHWSRPTFDAFIEATTTFGRDDAVSVAREMWQLGHVAHPVEALRYHERFWGWGAATYPDDLRKIEGKILGGEAEMGELVRAHAMSIAQIAAFRPAGSAAAAAASFGGSAAAGGAGAGSDAATLPPALRPGLPFEADLALQLINGGSKALGAATTVPPAPLVSKLHGGPVAYDGVPSAATAIDISPDSDGVLLASAAAIALRRVLPVPSAASSSSGAAAGVGAGAGASGAAASDVVQTETERFLAALGLAPAPAAGGSPLGSSSAAASDPLALRARLHQRMPADQLLDAEGLRRALLHTPSLALDRYAKTLTPGDAQGRYTALLRACEPTWEAQRRVEKAARDAERRARSQAFEDLASASTFLERRIKTTRDSLNTPVVLKPAAAAGASTGAAAPKPGTAAAAALKAAAAAKTASAGAAAKPGSGAAGGAGAAAAKPTVKTAAKPSAASSGGAGAAAATPTASSVGQKRKAPDATSGAGAGAAAGSASAGSTSAGAAPEDVVYYLGKTGAGSASHAGVKALQLHTLPALAKAIACAGIGAIKAIETAYLAAVSEADKPSLRQLQATINALAEKRKGTGWAVRSPYEGLGDMTGEAAAALMEKHPLKVSLKAIVKKPKLDAATASTMLAAGAGSSAGASGSSASNASAHPAASSTSSSSAAASGPAAGGAGSAAGGAAEVISIDDE